VSVSVYVAAIVLNVARSSTYLIDGVLLGLSLSGALGCGGSKYLKRVLRTQRPQKRDGCERAYSRNFDINTEGANLEIFHYIVSFLVPKDMVYRKDFPLYKLEEQIP